MEQGTVELIAIIATVLIPTVGGYFGISKQTIKAKLEKLTMLTTMTATMLTSMNTALEDDTITAKEAKSIAQQLKQMQSVLKDIGVKQL